MASLRYPVRSMLKDVSVCNDRADVRICQQSDNIGEGELIRGVIGTDDRLGAVMELPKKLGSKFG
jgi:hypothetical protein